MIDFMVVSSRARKNGVIEVYPNFIIRNPSRDLMIRGRDFYAIWLDDKGLWSTNEQDAIDLIDSELDKYVKENAHRLEGGYKVMYMRYAESGMIDIWHKYCQRQMRDSWHPLDEKIIFQDTKTQRNDYASKKLPYSLEDGEPEAWNRILSTLYSDKERRKIEWAIGAIVSGASRELQKFMVLYGAAGTGKSTVIGVIEKLFEGYTSVFQAKALGSSSNQFALEAFRDNPLVAIEHDGDLSRIEDNTRLNSLVSHEKMTINEKFKSQYTNRFKCFLFMGTNKPVHITDAKSGLLRRLIDVTPTGNKLPRKEYNQLMGQVRFELGAIANRCQEIFLSDPGAYDDYIPIAMLGASNDFYNFVMDSWVIFKREDSTTLKSAWEMYKTYCDDAKVGYPYSQRKFKEELKNYFREFEERETLPDGSRVRNLYKGFRADKFEEEHISPGKPTSESWLKLINQHSLLDDILADCPAQYASEQGTPMRKWANVKTKLSELDTTRTHYVKVPPEHIVIDFDMVNEKGEKDISINLREAAKWPRTYAEVSKGGNGVHLHYIYAGDTSRLSCVYDDKIEVKIFTGNSSLRRRRSLCNDIPIATLSSGLPFKEEKKVVSYSSVQSERGLRSLIERNLNKEIMGHTKPSIDFIHKILEDAYASDLRYDVSDMTGAVIAFAARSHNQAEYCLKVVSTMHFKSQEDAPASQDISYDEHPIVFFDIEVFPNLLLVNWKAQGEGKPVVRMINPKPSDIEGLLEYRLVGFNCRRYDNHILYARLMGYDNDALYRLSQRIVSGDRNAFFGEAYNLSYTDVYDFAAKKQSLKKWEIELGIHHKELGLPWDEPVPEEDWQRVAEYCDNDVLATEAVFDALSGDFKARQILASIAGMTVNDTTNSLTARIIFGGERHPRLVYTDLATGMQYFGDAEGKPSENLNAFPGYEYRQWREGDIFPQDKAGRMRNIYRGTDVGRGGYIKSWPGMYGNVALLDVASMHPNSIRAMNCFGEYTGNFVDILNARVAIKHKDFDTARAMLGGKLAPYLDDPKQVKELSQALKIAINSVYGLTAAGFDNPFRDPRNVNNIVALRGALFMRTLEDEITSRGFQIVAIKTDSIKIADATPEIISFCMEFAGKYGYSFEHEATYDKMCQVNDADYVAKYASRERCERMYGYIPGDNQDGAGKWTVTGALFAAPYIFKRVFSHEELEFKDFCETKEVKTAIYLDMNESLPDVSDLEKERIRLIKQDAELNAGRLNELDEQIARGHNYIFVGRVGLFCPMKDGAGGGVLLRQEDGGKFSAVTGTKGYRWMESEMVNALGRQDDIDTGYFKAMLDGAMEQIAQYGDVEWFVSEDEYDIPPAG